jgi:hypothetical protein
VFRALRRWLLNDPAQLSLLAPTTGEELLERLRGYGLRDIRTLTLPRNRTVMVSCRGGEMRVHRAFLDAPAPVLEAVATFVSGRTRGERARARRVLLGYAVPAEGKKRQEARHPEDAGVERRLSAAHAALNAERFGGGLKAMEVRVSRRMRSRLGHYRVANPRAQVAAEIVISRRHLKRHGWREAVDTLLHEMVHQWQDESGLVVDHGAAFRKKARAVGATPAARRPVGPAARRPVG